jgi:hypothetical protein
VVEKNQIHLMGSCMFSWQNVGIFYLFLIPVIFTSQNNRVISGNCMTQAFGTQRAKLPSTYVELLSTSRIPKYLCFMNRKSQTPGDRGTESQRDFIKRCVGTPSRRRRHPEVGRIAAAASVKGSSAVRFFCSTFP